MRPLATDTMQDFLYILISPGYFSHFGKLTRPCRLLWVINPCPAWWFCLPLCISWSTNILNILGCSFSACDNGVEINLCASLQFLHWLFWVTLLHLSPPQKKISAVTNLTSPNMQNHLHRFLSILKFYWRSFPNCVCLCNPGNKIVLQSYQRYAQRPSLDRRHLKPKLLLLTYRWQICIPAIVLIAHISY